MEQFDWRNTPIHTGPTLIEASAGTGKTYTITGLYLRLLLEERVSSVRNILVVTYTKAATQELTERIRNKLLEALAVFRYQTENQELEPIVARHRERGTQILMRAILELDELCIFTIHSFCKRMLEHHAFESGLTFTSHFLEDYDTLLQEAARDFWRRTFLESSPLLSAIAVVLDWSWDELLAYTKNCRGYAQAQFEPKPSPMDLLLANLETSLLQMRQHWDLNELGSQIDSLKFLADSNPAKKLQYSFLSTILDTAITTEINSETLQVLKVVTNAFHLEKLYKKQQADPAIADLLDHPFFQSCRQFAAIFDQFDLGLKHAFLLEVERLYRDLKKHSQQLDYDDLLEQLHTALNHPNHGETIRLAIASQYRAALIDEFQDTDQLQFEIFHSIFASAPLYFIGDPKQAIYGFRGADLHAYLEAKKVAKRHYTLATNWRSHEDLVEAVNTLFQSKLHPFIESAIPYLPVKASGQFNHLGLDDGEAALHLWLYDASQKNSFKSALIQQLVIEEIQRLLTDLHLGGRPVCPDDVAILVRTNTEAAEYLAALRKAGIPSVVAKSGDIFKTQEIKHLYLFTRALVFPQRQGALQAGMVTALWGATAESVLELQADENRLQDAFNIMESLRQVWRRQGFLAMVYRAFDVFGTQQRLLSEPEGAASLTNLRHAAEIVESQSRMASLSHEGILRWLELEMGKDHHPGMEAELRMPTYQSGIRIMTMHKSKGLEYEIVFCPGFSKEHKPNKTVPKKFRNDAGNVIFDLGLEPSGDHKELAIQESISEELRLLYVALTRAKQRCYLVWGTGRRNSLQWFNDQDPQSIALWSQQWPQLISARLLDPQWEPARDIRPLSDTQEIQLLPARQFKRREAQVRPWQFTSFSALTANHTGQKAHRYDPDQGPSDMVGTGFFGFARGPRAGNCLHEILEKFSFAELDNPDTPHQIEILLHRYDFLDPNRHLSPIDPVKEVLAMMRRLGKARLPELETSLQAIPPENCLKEWPFQLSLKKFQPSDFRKLFEKHGNSKQLTAYTNHLKHLRPGLRLDGFLTGIVDMCFVHEGRWFVIDWKSNDLGPTHADYHHHWLWESMCEHHYVLQYHLYTLALHRFLGVRLADYDYEKHFGGIYYAFLRGIDGEGSNGWYFDRPSLATIQAFDQLCQGVKL